MKRLESKPTTSYSLSASSAAQKEVSPFEAMKATIRNNLKGLKKEEDKDSGDHSGLGGLGSSTSVGNNPSVIGGSSNAGSSTSRRVSLINGNFRCSFRISSHPSAMAKTSGKLISSTTCSD